MLTLPLDTRLLSSSQNYSPLLSWMTKGKSLRGRHLFIIGRASILIFIIIITISSILIIRSLRRRRWRSNEVTKASLSSCDMIDMGGHLTQLVTESVKASINALKLCHDRLESHTTTRRRKSGGGRNGRGWRIHCLHPRLLQSKLGLASPNRSCANGTHDSIERRIKKRDGKMVKDLCDSRRKNELIMGRRIPIDIYERKNEMKRKVYGEVL